MFRFRKKEGSRKDLSQLENFQAALPLHIRDLLVKDYYTSNVPILPSSANVGEVLNVFLQYGLDVACIIENHQFYGIVSKSSIFRFLLQGANLQTSISSIVLRQVITVNVEDSLEKAKDILLTKRIGHGVVIDRAGNIQGVMGKADIIQGFLCGTELLVNQLQGLIEHLQDAVISVDKEQKITTFNYAAEWMLHHSKQTLLGQSIATYYPELAPYLSHALQTREALGPLRIELQGRIVHASFIPISSAHRINHAMAVLQDITSLETIAKELESTKNLEQILQSAIAMSYDGMMIMDPKGHITVANDAFLEIFKLTREHTMGAHWSEKVPQLSLHDDWKEEFSDGKICFIEENRCFVTQEPIVRSGIHLGTIVKIILRQLEQWRDVFRHLEELETKLHFYRDEIKRMQTDSNAFDRILSKDEQMNKIKHQARMAAQGISTVLLTGESGTGKELFAEAIHEESGRKGKFIKINCAAIPTELLESEFFGYAEGAFTGARKGGKPGKFELAHEGTLFLDEIGDMPLSLQSKMLRVLQEQKFERLGGIHTIDINVRIIAATNKNLELMIQEGTFRADLYYRIHVVHLDIPPLRKRPQDIGILCDYLLKKLNQKLHRHVIGVTPHALALLEQYTWPGNIRQLENVLERAMNLEIYDWIEPHHLSDEFAGDYLNQNRVDLLDSSLLQEKTQTIQMSVAQTEKHAIIDALQNAQGNRSKAAQILGIGRSTLYQKLKKYNIKEASHFISNSP